MAEIAEMGNLMLLMICECLLYFFITGESADVIALSGHLPGIDLGLGAKPSDETAGGISAATALNGFLDEVAIVLGEIIESWHTPMALRLSGFLLHGNEQVVIGHLGHTTLMELGFIGLVIAHDTGGVLLLTILDKVGKTEIKEIVTGHHQEVVIKGFTI